MRSFVQEHAEQGLEWSEPSGGTTAFVRLRGLGAGGATEYTNALRRRRDLMLIPSALFEEAADDRVRVTFGRAQTIALLERWRDDLREHGLRATVPIREY